MSKESFASLDAQQKGGAGLLADENLRYFQRDYTNRVLSHGPNSLPTSYEILDAFFEHRKDLPGFFLLPEKDYLFSFSDFLEYVTEATAPSTNLQALRGFEENVVYHATSQDLPDALLLETLGTSAYSVRAASLVLRGEYLTVMLCLAEQLPEKKLAELVFNPENLVPNPIKLTLHEQLKTASIKPALIPGTELLSSIAMVRFDLNTGQMHSRGLMRDMTDTFRVWTDTASALSYSGVQEESVQFLNMVKELDAADALWEVAKTMTLLPAYLKAKVSNIQQQQKPTLLGRSASVSSKIRQGLKGLRNQDKVLFRTIAAVQAMPRGGPLSVSGRSFVAPAFQVPVAGYWRVYSDTSRIGHDVNGLPVSGKTWVKAHTRHKDKAPAPDVKVVYIKASLSEARARLAKYRATQGIPEGTQLPVQVELPSLPLTTLSREAASGPEAPRETGAFVYVMRCHAHSENLFKVGFTDRDPQLRAKELSAATSAPSPFTVLQAWVVTDGYAAEQSAHAELRDVRLSANREFFQLGYQELCSRIERSLRGWLI